MCPGLVRLIASKIYRTNARIGVAKADTERTKRGPSNSDIFRKSAPLSEMTTRWKKVPNYYESKALIGPDSKKDICYISHSTVSVRYLKENLKWWHRFSFGMRKYCHFLSVNTECSKMEEWCNEKSRCNFFWHFFSSLRMAQACVRRPLHSKKIQRKKNFDFRF